MLSNLIKNTTYKKSSNPLDNVLFRRYPDRTNRYSTNPENPDNADPGSPADPQISRQVYSTVEICILLFSHESTALVQLRIFF